LIDATISVVSLLTECGTVPRPMGVGMVRLRSGAFAIAALLCSAGASGASAADIYYVSSVTTVDPSSQWVDLNVGSYGSFAASGILFTLGGDSPTDAGKTILTLCDDIFHDIGVPITYSPELKYTAAALTGNTYFIDDQGHTNTFSAKQASLLGQLVTEAQSIYSGSSAPSLFGLKDKSQEIDAIQGAIWAIEYKTNVTDSHDGAITTAISDFESQYSQLPSGGMGLYTSGGTQDQVLGIPASPAPEPGTWAMMLVGLLGLSAAVRASRHTSKSQVSA
jgi:hypothetical protein